jgi:hypothetical protein
MPKDAHGICCPFCGSSRARSWEIGKPIPDYYGAAPFCDAVWLCVDKKLTPDPCRCLLAPAQGGEGSERRRSDGRTV